MGGCFRIPGEHYRNFTGFGQAMPGEHEFDLRCKDCFPAGRLAQQEAEKELEASDSDGSVSSQSSAQESDAELEN